MSHFREAGSLVVWTRYELRADYLDAGRAIRRNRPGMRAHGALVAETWDAELWCPSAVRPDDVVLPKARMSALIGTPLDLLLRDLRISTVHIAGLTTSMCVESTARDLAQRDHDVRVLTDATADFSPARHAASLDALQFGFADLMTTEDAIADLPAPKDRPLATKDLTNV